MRLCRVTECGKKFPMCSDSNRSKKKVLCCLAESVNKIDQCFLQDHQDMVGRTEKEVLSPGRLDSTRFSEFTKSSYVPQPAQRQISIERSPGYVKYSAEETDDVERNKREINVTVMEKKNKSIPEQHTARFQIKNDWDEPVKQNRNSYERVSKKRRS